MPKLVQLGHVGVYVKEWERARNFYRDILGLEVTDEKPERGIAFLSARPEKEHHEVALFHADAPEKKIQQISFHVSSLKDLKEYHRLFKENGVKIDETVTHGNALSIYFFDPEGNRLEVYWDTGIRWKQPFKKDVDLTLSDEELLKAHLE